MNPHDFIKQLDLAAWEFAEAEAHERMARALRIEGSKRLAAVHLDFREALARAQQTPKPKQES